MGFLAPLLGEAAGAAGGAGAATAGATGAGAGRAMTGLAGMGPELATATTPSFSRPPTTGGLDSLKDMWNSQPKWARGSLTETGLNGLANQRPNLPTPAPMNPGMSQMSMPSPMSLPPLTGGQYGGGTDMSAMAPFLQALARRQGINPFGFGTPSAYFS